MKQRLPFWKLLFWDSLLENTFRMKIGRNCQRILPVNVKITYLKYVYLTWVSVMGEFKTFLYAGVCNDNVYYFVFPKKKKK